MMGNKDVIVITGGAGGIGTAVVRRYASAGCRVLITDLNETVGQALASECGDNVSFHRVDVTDYSSVVSFTEYVGEEIGFVTHLVSLAGGALDEEAMGRTFEDVSVVGIDYTIRWNLNSHIYMIKALIPLFRACPTVDKSITLVSSINALFSFGQPAYSAAKAGLIGIARGSANDLGRLGVRINVVLPGSVPTGASEPFLSDIYSILSEASSLKRLSTPEDLAGAIYAFSHLMTSVTGQYLPVDAGQLICYPYRKKN